MGVTSGGTFEKGPSQKPLRLHVITRIFVVVGEGNTGP